MGVGTFQCAPRGTRLVLLSIANHVVEDGSGAWPSIATLSRESGLCEREVRYTLRKLDDLGELIIERGAGPKGTHLYMIPFIHLSRKYGERELRPLPLWNCILEHYDRIGDALWEFIWLIDNITEGRDGVGIVLGGAPITLRDIADALKGTTLWTVRRHMDALEKGGYIRRRMTPYGYVIEVLNTKKTQQSAIGETNGRAHTRISA